MTKINMPPEYAGLLNLVLLMSVDSKITFFQDKQMASYWREDMAWLAEFRCQTPSKIRKQQRLEQLERRQTEYKV